MGILTIDETKCKRDGICAAECPRRIIEQKGKEDLPLVTAENEPFCMACGHCVAVCPHGAISVAGVAIDDCPDIDRDLILSWEQAVQFLRSRRSIRVYKEEPVDRAVLTRLIEAARYAPTASNGQLIHYTIIEDRDKLLELSARTIAWMEKTIAANPDSPAAWYFRPVVSRWANGYDDILRSAPTLIIASAPEENTNGLVDLSIALSYLELAALPLGVGTCWGGFLRGAMAGTPELVDFIGLPEGHTWFYPLMIGYPKFRYHRLPERKPPNITWK